MRKILTIIVTALAIAMVAAPIAAIADGPDEPVSDAMATQDPAAYDAFINRPCEKRSSVNCYWDAIGKTGRVGQSYWAIRVGKQVCIRYWDNAYNRKHGHCAPIHHHR